jgi:hypothetical protein
MFQESLATILDGLEPLDEEFPPILDAPVTPEAIF